jgi:hypothetical protein
MMNFKTPLTRLVRHLFQSREKWKARALENQKELRKSQIKTRDLEVSRRQWKERAKQAEKELSLAQREQKQEQLPEAQHGENSVQKCLAVTRTATTRPNGTAIRCSLFTWVSAQ